MSKLGIIRLSRVMGSTLCNSTHIYGTCLSIVDVSEPEAGAYSVVRKSACGGSCGGSDIVCEPYIGFSSLMTLHADGFVAEVFDQISRGESY